ncbi:DUF4910 domain-containing protein [Chloroflexi bacterium TSY]|nr:DUF4910 domain-containing protein [Chloroflexi bacterium TSY]
MQNIAKLIHHHLSGDNAQALTEAITQFWRAPGSSGYHAATNLVAERLRAIGIPEIDVNTYPLDGETQFLHQTMPLAWEPYNAVVRTTGPTQEPLVNFDDAPSCLMPWSCPTPPGGMTAELVDLGTGESDADFADKDLDGKVVFIHHTEHRALWTYAATKAMERGAKGILTDYLLYQTAPFRTRETLPWAVQLLRLPNNKGKFDAWGCAVDHPTGQHLRELLHLGPVTIHANIQCRIFKGKGQNLLATIPGRQLPDESVFFIAHTSAAANCAAGPALMVEMARTLHTLIESGEIPRPRRSIKFLFVAEGLGSEAYIHRNRSELDKIKTAFCLDSVGHHQEKCNSALLFYRHPDSTPSFINDYFAGVMERVPKDTSWVFAEDNGLSPIIFEQAPYTPWSDNHYWATFGVPSPLIMSWPDRCFHTQLLTAEMTNPRVFRAAGISLALAAYEIADAGLQEALVIADEVATRSLYRLDTVGNQVARAVIEESGELQMLEENTARQLDYFAQRDGAAIASIQTLLPDQVPEQAQASIALQQALLQEKAVAVKERISQRLA